METDSRDFAAIRLERYGQWERASPITCVVLATVAAISAVTFHPDVLAVAGNVLGGAVVFLFWRAAIRQRETLTITLGILGVVLALSEPVPDRATPVLIQMAKGVPWYGLGLFLGIYVYRNLGTRHSA